MGFFSYAKRMGGGGGGEKITTHLNYRTIRARELIFSHKNFYSQFFPKKI